MKFEELVTKVAERAVAKKIVDGDGLEGLTFPEAVKLLEDKILEMVASGAFGKTPPPGPPKARKYTPSKPKREKAATPGKGIDPLELEAVLRVSAVTLNALQQRFGVSQGVAMRAIKALAAKGLSVVEGKAEREPGARGKSATTYAIPG